MHSMTYLQRKLRIERYFDDTAAQRWVQLTSDAPLGRIRETVRLGRERMRTGLLDWLGSDLHGQRVFDAGCGTGALAIAAAQRGAEVTAVDLSPKLIEQARSRVPVEPMPGRVRFVSGDMLEAGTSTFDHVVAMDSLIHYRGADMLDMLAALSLRARHSMLFTFAPCTPLLTLMHTVGRLIPASE
ncbi:MAG: magnesium protoporphyrin IX methyltransferase, partial [Gammaproteobacteria bacterium]|nr:magnesium protoporphyrin IX methyltransferase [Gammaproteobacteria bacterium]